MVMVNQLFRVDRNIRWAAISAIVGCSWMTFDDDANDDDGGGDRVMAATQRKITGSGW